MIRYKVVNKNRESIIVKGSEYYLKYETGSTVKAKDNTLGIFCFKRKKDAKNFVVPGDKILRVIPLKRGNIPECIAISSKNISFETSIKYFYEGNRDIYRIAVVPQGTICYPEVFVVD